MTMTWAKVKQGRRAGYTSNVTLNDLEDMASVTDGEHLMRAIVEGLEKKKIESAEPGALVTTQSGSENLYATFQWIPHGKDVDLLIENSKTFLNNSFSPWVGIDLEFALKMEWIKKKLDGRTYVLGPNLLVHSRTFSTDPQVLGVLVNAKREPVLWQVNNQQQVILRGRSNGGSSTSTPPFETLEAIPTGRYTSIRI